MAEPLRIKGSDGKTYLNPKADRDPFARFLDGFIQMLSGGSYGPDYNMYGKPVPQISLDQNEVPVITTQETPVSEAPVAPVVTDTENPVVSEQMSPESLARQAETDRMVDVIMNVPLKKEPELSAEDKAREAFFARKNNPARRAGLDDDFLFARHKANLVSKLAKQDVKPADLEGTEQAFLAKQLEKYIGNKRQFNSGRDRGF